MLRRLYDWVLEQSRSKYAEWALFWLAFAESSFFPIPPDVLLITMVLAEKQKWVRYFVICLFGSVLGGAAGYFIGLGFWGATSPFFLEHVFSEEAFRRVQGLYMRYDFWIVFAAGFTPIPYKVFTITAGVAAIDFPQFVLASIFGRGGRFILVAYLLHKFGAPVRGFIEKYLNYLTIVFTILLIGGFWLVKHSLH